MGALNPNLDSHCLPCGSDPEEEHTHIPCLSSTTWRNAQRWVGFDLVGERERGGKGSDHDGNFPWAGQTQVGTGKWAVISRLWRLVEGAASCD